MRVSIISHVYEGGTFKTKLDLEVEKTVRQLLRRYRVGWGIQFCENRRSVGRVGVYNNIVIMQFAVSVTIVIIMAWSNKQLSFAVKVYV